MAYHYEYMVKVGEIREQESYGNASQDAKWKLSMEEEMHALAVEIQAQDEPDRLRKLRDGSDEDRSGTPGPNRRAGLEDRIHGEPDRR